ncbi:hypothetical protein TL16_g02716 [Triparma laevis f. inornata]|uniref:Uncharacterized protein n=1 Tax=Triparma laevis f. inornata TaxID=1714386 RepID=A0A9W6ZZZ4_9STRA|nr:hypothetical protein TL16_g02716 [Triparma laevis f. inornata]
MAFPGDSPPPPPNTGPVMTPVQTNTRFWARSTGVMALSSNGSQNTDSTSDEVRRREERSDELEIRDFCTLLALKAFKTNSSLRSSQLADASIDSDYLSLEIIDMDKDLMFVAEEKNDEGSGSESESINQSTSSTSMSIDINPIENPDVYLNSDERSIEVAEAKNDDGDVADDESIDSEAK